MTSPTQGPELLFCISYFLNFFWRTFCEANDTQFGLLVTSALGFKAMVDRLDVFSPV